MGLSEILGLVLLLAFVFSDMSYAQNALNADDFINILEDQVTELSRQAETNFLSSCELLATCHDLNCSRHACSPVGGDEGYVCTPSHNSKSCYNMDGALGCKSMRVSFTKSFVRTSTPAINLTKEENTTICAQRSLTDTLRNIWFFPITINTTNAYYAMYFGSMEGIQRYFPGVDFPSENGCIFEPRKRPWYIGVTAVRKDVMVLLDTGNSMGDTLPSDMLVAPDTSKLSASISIITDLLDTLAFGDRVTVITFTSSGATTVLPPIAVTGDATTIQPLKTALQTSVAFDNAQGGSSLTSAFILANQTFASAGDVLKVVLILTGGQIKPVNATDNVFDSIRSIGTLVQIFSFDRTPTTLQMIACDLRGSYERITSVQNPLYTLRSYFGILARMRFTATNNKPSWTRSYLDAGGQMIVITVVFPTFADNYTLVGVAAIDVLLDDLGPITQYEFTTALARYRDTDPILNLKPPPLPCPFGLSTADQCPEVIAPAALYPFTDTSGITLEQRMCDCPGECLASPLEVDKARDSSTWKIAVGVASGCAAVLVLGALLVRQVFLSRRRMSEEEEEEFLTSLPGLPPRFSYSELESATGKFTKVLGRGGFGTVYEGALPDGSKVAVKRLGEAQGAGFRAEVATIGSINHHYLVRLRGFCCENAQRMLVYEFMENGSLDRWLFTEAAQEQLLPWEARHRIATGTARGLSYLHHDCRHKILHLDVKPQNILLDARFHAKVADFGMSKLFDRDASQVVTGMRGTPGYLAPEWLLQTGITEKCDVWSFGMVLLELVSGRRNVDTTAGDRWYFPAFAILCAEDKSWGEIIDPRILESLTAEDWEQVERVMMIAMWCIQDAPRARPTMAKVVQMLEGVVEVENPPLQFEFLQLVGGEQPSDSILLSPYARSAFINVRELADDGFVSKSEVLCAKGWKPLDDCRASA